MWAAIFQGMHRVGPVAEQNDRLIQQGHSRGVPSSDAPAGGRDVPESFEHREPILPMCGFAHIPHLSPESFSYSPEQDRRIMCVCSTRRTGESDIKAVRREGWNCVTACPLVDPRYTSSYGTDQLPTYGGKPYG